MEAELSALEGKPVQIVANRAAVGGCINNGAHLTTSTRKNYFVKWNAHSPPFMFTREGEGLRALESANSGLCIPAVFAVKERGEGIPAYILLQDVRVVSSNPASANYEEELGRGLAKLHEKTESRFGFSHDNFIGSTPQSNSWSQSWSEFFINERIQKMAARLSDAGKMDASSRKLCDEFCAALPTILSHNPAPALVHGDLWSGNALHTDNGSPALIDPAAYYADAEVDLAMMQLFGGFSMRVFAAYHEHTPAVDGYEDRLSIYNTYHLLNHALLFGGGYLAQAQSAMRRFA